MRKLRWNNIKEIKRSLSAINNMLLNDEISTDKSRAIAHNCNVILSAIKQFEVEKEIEELKQMLEELKNNKE